MIAVEDGANTPVFASMPQADFARIARAADDASRQR